MIDQQPSSTDETTAIAPVESKRITRTKVTPERLDKYIEVLRATGSHFEAARVATPFANEVKPGSEPHGGTTPPSGYATFSRERKINPDFARRCDEAIQDAIGAAESLLAERMRLPTERASLDKQGNIVHITKDYRNADLLLLRFLARHKPDTWTELQKREVSGTMTVQNNTAVNAGAAYVITPEMLSMLTEADQLTLGEIMCRVEDARLKLESAKVANLLEDQSNAA